jgi:RHS repeat-associated protein
LQYFLSYLPFGEVRALTGPSLINQTTDFGYTGQRNLAGSSGLMDYKARFYDPSLGRFLQPDLIVSNPANPQTWNRYSYVGNNSVNMTDPTGHMETGECGARGEECSRKGDSSKWDNDKTYVPKPDKRDRSNHDDSNYSDDGLANNYGTIYVTLVSANS